MQMEKTEKPIVRGKMTFLLEQASAIKNSTTTLEGKQRKYNLNK